MGFLSDLGGGLGDIAGLFSSGGSDDDANQFYRKLVEQMKGVDPTITAQTVGPISGTGIDAVSRAQLAEATTAANRNASANREGVIENAAAGGMRNSGVTGALQEMGGQQAMGDANLAASHAAATSVAAKQAIDRFNAMMRQGAQQQTFGNKMGQLAGEGDLYNPAWKAGVRGEDRTSRLWGSIGRFAGGVGDAFANKGSMPSWMSGDMTGGASYT